MSYVSILAIAENNSKYTFTVDNTVKEVNVFSGGGVDIAFTVTNLGIVHWFNPGENIKLLSFGIFCPHAYVLGSEYPIMRIEAKPNGLASDIVYDGLIVPFLNVEIDIDKRIDLEPTQRKADPPVSNTLNLFIETAAFGSISMLNSPDIMNSEVVELIPWIKVEHNFPLTAVP